MVTGQMNKDGKECDMCQGLGAGTYGKAGGGGGASPDPLTHDEGGGCPRFLPPPWRTGLQVLWEKLLAEGAGVFCLFQWPTNPLRSLFLGGGSEGPKVSPPQKISFTCQNGTYPTEITWVFFMHDAGEEIFE